MFFVAIIFGVFTVWLLAWAIYEDRQTYIGEQSNAPALYVLASLCASVDVVLWIIYSVGS